jgi:hypothetical protein
LSFIYVCLRACCCYNGQNGIDEARFAKEVKKLQKAK